MVKAPIGPFNLTLVVAALVPAYAWTAGAIADDSENLKGTGGVLGGRLVIGQIPVQTGSRGKGAVRFPASDEPLPVGSRIISLDPAKPDSAHKNLTPDFVAAGRPDISFDGKRMLFIGRKTPENNFAVWEMSCDGGKLRQVTHRTADALQAIYLPRLFILHNDRPESRIAFLESARPGDPASLHNCRKDGTDVMRITYNPHGVYDPMLLSDGRLLYSSRRGPKPQSGGDGGSALFTVFPDGTDVFAFAGGNANNKGAVPDLGVHLRNDPAWNDVDAVPAMPRPLPAGRSSAVDRSSKVGWLYCLNAYESNLAGDGNEGRIARIQVMVPDTAAGRHSKSVPAELGAPALPGLGDRCVLVDQGPARATLDSPGEKLLGEAPVEEDGSFFLELPAGLAVRLKTLDENGNVLQAMRSWIWVMPNEARGCIGCHEDRELTPPNRHVLALRKRASKIGIGLTGVVPQQAAPVPGETE